MPFFARVEIALACGDDFIHSGCEHFLAQRGEIVVPAEFVPEFERLALVGRKHRFEIDLVLKAGALRDLCEHFSPVAIHDRIEFSECREEVIADGAIVARADVIADGPGVNHLIAKWEICERLRGGELALRGVARRLRERALVINTEAVFDCVLNVAFRVDRAGEVMMQIAAFGHAMEEIFEEHRIAANIFEILSRALGGGLRVCCCRRQDDACKHYAHCD